MRVLVTRAAPEAEATAARVRAIGCEAVVSPVLEIEPVAFSFDPEGVQALLFTSAAGVRAFGSCDLPALVVGEGTAAAAREAGFADVRSAEGGGAELIRMARALVPQAGALAHVSGEDVATDISAVLRESGFATRRLVVYRAKPAAALSDEALAHLRVWPVTLDSALFHSARGVESFLRLARAANLYEMVYHMRALCLGPRVAAAISTFDFKEISVAAAPTETALLSLLEETAGERA
jgi:uroporphyrinogen-III synthase